jgi:hypothetical protein
MLLMLFGAEFASGFGVMVLDIAIGVIFAAIVPDTMRSRVSGAFQAINYLGDLPDGHPCRRSLSNLLIFTVELKHFRDASAPSRADADARLPRGSRG